MKKTMFLRLFMSMIAIVGLLTITGCPQPSNDPDEDAVPPTVASTVPAAAAEDVALNVNVVATFSEAMDEDTIIGANFSLMAGSTPVAGAIAYDADSMTVTFNPTANLSPSTEYTATISDDVTDEAGNDLEEDYAWSFTTGLLADTIAPTVLSTVPVDEATGIAIDGNITAAFSEAMSSASVIAGFTVSDGADVSGTVTYDAGTHIATFDPTGDLSASTVYTATISVGALDLADNAIAAAKVWSFTTAAPGADTTAPTVASTLPAQGALNVAVGANITATFDEEMDLATMVGANFTVWKDTAAVAGVVTFDQASKTITFNPGADLIAAGAFGPVYTARITAVAQDSAGNNMVADKVWTFTPGSGTRAAVNLLTAGDFVILAQDLISNVPTSAINGDMGLSPAAFTFYTGFTTTLRDDTGAVVVDIGDARYATATEVSGTGVYPTIGSGAIYSVSMLGDAGLTKTKVDTAVADRITAYNDAAGRATPDVLNVGAGTINAVTFAPGLYTWGTDLEITGDITLTGTATDIWIFQVSGTINLASAAEIVLSGGALPENVFWQTAGITTLGTNSIFRGIILDASDIVLQTGSRLEGRALSFTQVTLDQVIVNQP